MVHLMTSIRQNDVPGRMLSQANQPIVARPSHAPELGNSPKFPIYIIIICLPFANLAVHQHESTASVRPELIEDIGTATL